MNSLCLRKHSISKPLLSRTFCTIEEDNEGKKRVTFLYPEKASQRLLRIQSAIGTIYLFRNKRVSRLRAYISFSLSLSFVKLIGSTKPTSWEEETNVIFLTWKMHNVRNFILHSLNNILDNNWKKPKSNFEKNFSY